MLEGKNILVTGGAGFIGANLCEALIEKNKVTCMDNLLTGRKKNIEPFLKHENFQFLNADIRNYESCIEAVRGVDVVLHQAALGSVPRSVAAPLPTHEHNIDGFLNMLEAAKNEKVKRFVYATSSSTYGDEKGLPKIEDKIGKPLSPYGVTKLVNELYADVYSRLYGIETVGLRYFNVFGPKQDPEGAYAAVIPKFIKKIHAGDSITIHGDGKQTRDFTYIKNVVAANILAASVEDTRAVNSIYNIAFGEQISLNQLVDIIREAFQNSNIETEPLEVIYGDKRKGDIEHSHASIAKAKNLMGYNPNYNLVQGINEYLKYLKENNFDY